MRDESMSVGSLLRNCLLWVMVLAGVFGVGVSIAAAEEDQAPVSISVDGETVFGSSTPVDVERKTDVALENVDIQVKFDGLEVKPILNVSTWPIRRSYQAGEEINFLASSNYPAWIAKSEIRVFEKGREGEGSPLYRIDVLPEGAASWTSGRTCRSGLCAAGERQHWPFR
jgi:hypothetical protein